MQPLVVPGTLEALAEIAAYVLDAAQVAGLDKKATYRLRLAVDEIATNIAVHGYAEVGRTGDITVYRAIDERSLTITLEDTARPYDPRAFPVPDQLDRALQERVPGGLGIYLALKGVDRFAYTYENNRNHNIFVMDRPATAQPTDSAWFQ